MGEVIRVQLSRAKGWRMPPNTVKVIRMRRKDPQERQEADAILEVYLTALGMN